MNNNQTQAAFSEWLQGKNGRSAALCKNSTIFVPPIISKLKTGRVPFSLMYAMEIDRLTAGQFRAEELCPKHADIINHLRGEAK